MSLGGSLSGISFGGLSSGIDTNAIIERLLQIEALPIQRLQQQQQILTTRQTVFSQFRSQLTSLSTAAGALNKTATFNPISASSSNSAVATISASSSAVAGSYNLSVSKLAQAQKIASAAQTDTTSALGLSGEIIVNGKGITVETSDTLASLSQKINAAGAGVTASIIDGGSGSAYLTLSSSNTGASNEIQISDYTGTVASTLGLTSGSTAVREAISGGAASLKFSASDETISTLVGLSSMASATIQVNGSNVSIDPTTDTLQDVADKINAAGTGATATVASVTENGTTTYRLEITGSPDPTYTDDQGFLEAIGILQKGYANELIQAQDAEFTLDTISLTSSTNTVTTAIPGATLTLLKANSSTPETSVITLNKDNDAIKEKIVAFKEAYNKTIDFIRENQQFDTETFASGPLFGDPVARQIEDSIVTLVFNNVPGLSGDIKNLTDIGFGIDQDGKLTLDDSVLTQAIAAKPDSVSSLFRAVGTTTTNDLVYVSSTSKTNAGDFNVNITQAATKGSYTSSVAQVALNTNTETLTFDGLLFGNVSYDLVLNASNTLADTIDQINNDSSLKNLVLASDEGGFLKITSKKYGNAGNFTVVSDTTAAGNNSGIGTSSGGTAVTGLDVAGTINGEAATGFGQFLTGDDDAATVAGLQIQYSGSSTGSIGNVNFVKGVGMLVTDLVNGFTDSINGLLTATDQSLQAQIDDIANSISDLQDRLLIKQQDLALRFARMEEAISQAQAQGQRLAAIQGGG